MPRARRIVLGVMGTSLSCYRELLRGFVGYANERSDWRLEYCLPTEDVPRLARRLRADGLLLGTMANRQRAARAAASVAHCVGVCGQHADAGVRGLTEVESDDRAVGELAADHFIQKGFVHFGFVAAVDGAWSDRRVAGFRHAVERAGRQLAIHKRWVSDAPLRRTANVGFAADLRLWLAQQPKPLALMACNDLLAREVTTACREAGVRVPEEVSIIGVDNDDLECELSHPPLSSVVIPWRPLGRLAAELLSNMLDGRRVPRRVHLIGPAGVAERQSTDLVAVDDPDVRAALRFIRQHAREPVDVDAVAAAVPISRRMLERRFRVLLGRSPLEEIRRIRIERAKMLLSRTNMAMSEIAAQSGFSDSAWFSKAFHDEVGQAPTQYRVRHRKGKHSPLAAT